MSIFEAKPAWVDSNPNGKHCCDKCPYKTDSSQYLQDHNKRFHRDKAQFILYMACPGSLDGRNTLADGVSFKWIDMTGGQAAFIDGDLKKFGDELVRASRKTHNKLYHVYRMHDPGLGLDFPQWWVDTGVKLGIFQEYKLPEDVKAEPEVGMGAENWYNPGNPTNPTTPVLDKPLNQICRVCNKPIRAKKSSTK